jgi:hypothetical protein
VRTARNLVVISVVVSVWILTLGVPRHSGSSWAQLGAPPAPLPAPPPPPGAAPTAGAAVIPGAASLAPAPGSTAAIAQPTPTPSSRIYNCSCYNVGTRVRWIGQVQASSFYAARQNAVNSCVAYNFNRRPSSAFIPPPVFSFFPTPVPPVAASQTEPALPTLQAPGLSGFALLNSPRAVVLAQCGLCSCD